MFYWRNEYSSGVPSIDAQHKSLFTTINALESLCLAHDIDSAEANRLLLQLEAYFIGHFKHEEGCMLRHRCPAHEANKDAHKQFMEVFESLKARHGAEGSSRELLLELHTILGDWLGSHILRVDTQIKRCVLATPRKP